MRIRNFTQADGHSSPNGRPRSVDTSMYALASGTQSQEEPVSSNFQPWLRDDERYLNPRAQEHQRLQPAIGKSAIQGDLQSLQVVDLQDEQRNARVAELQKRIDSGHYMLNSIVLARSMLGFHDDRTEVSPG